MIWLVLLLFDRLSQMNVNFEMWNTVTMNDQCIITLNIYKQKHDECTHWCSFKICCPHGLLFLFRRIQRQWKSGKKRLLVSDGKLSQLPNPNAWVEFDDFGCYTPKNELTQRVIGLFLANIFSLSHIPKIFSHENRKNQRKCDFSATNDD